MTGNCIFNCRWKSKCKLSSHMEDCPSVRGVFSDKISYIVLDQCVDGNTYAIYARNGMAGIFNKEKASFTLNRQKFDQIFLFDEYHWDTGIPHGTVRPYKDLGPTPKMNEDSEKLLYLENVTISLLQDG